MARIISAFEQFFDGDGEPLVNGLLDFFQSGSTTIRKDTFADVSEKITNTNPVVLNGDGRAPNIFGTGTYRVVVRDSLGNQIQVRDPVGGDPASGVVFGASWVSTVIYGINDVVRDENNYWISLTNDNIGNQPSLDAGVNWAPTFPEIESGTSMLFNQTNAPFGWTKSTAHDNKAIRIVSGTVGDGGTVAFTTAFNSKSVTGTNTSVASGGTVTVNNHTLTAAQSGLVGHDHIQGVPASSDLGSESAMTLYGWTTTGSNRRSSQYGDPSLTNEYPNTETISSVGASSGHNHTASISGTNHTHAWSYSGTDMDLDVLYVDSIIAVRD